MTSSTVEVKAFAAVSSDELVDAGFPIAIKTFQDRFDSADETVIGELRPHRIWSSVQRERPARRDRLPAELPDRAVPAIRPGGPDRRHYPSGVQNHVRGSKTIGNFGKRSFRERIYPQR
ncbi:hypothetical protein [Amycolatopsis taiwanensis]|uniref:hypothetical protein n=1 Tax=Amycolatopsis taiwanensis TaxID=342230 RepID=UPI0012EBB21C|nr:hypothetical protein [Amycolatopsis taiwanensis]